MSLAKTKKLVKAQLIAGKIGRIAAIKDIYNAMPDGTRGLKEARDIVDKMAPELIPKSYDQMTRQRQDSLASQMLTVKRLAEKEGCYDAADYIKNRFQTIWEQAGMK